jgi:cyclopropane fatty-acyl-phospholipid synthase-like methyltransferase
MLASIRSVLSNPTAYQLWWNVVGGPASTKVLVSEYIQPKSGTRILEIGCGPGNIARYFTNYEYVGFDVNSKYIAAAQRRFPKATFVCERVSQFSLADRQSFDIVLAIGIVHHLSDGEANQLFRIAYDALKPGGKLVTFDGVWTDDQSAATRWLLSRDRGEHVRSEPEYVGIASQVFAKVRPSIRHDLLRIPYSHLILQCVR